MIVSLRSGPVEMIPTPLLWLAQLSPSTNAIKGFLALNQMGASWQQIANYWSTLWLVAAFWLVLCLFQTVQQRRADRRLA
ncbi:ABC transporter permease, partial [Vibrio diabolicus]|nr:ABC transporter permease [Vibrio diabolicus]